MDESISVSKKIEAPVKRAWQAWADVAELSTWFTSTAKQEFREEGTYENGDGGKGVFMEIVQNSRLTFTWENAKQSPGSLVMVEFMSEGPSRATITIVHEKLADKAAAEEMRKRWTWALASLKGFLETGKPIKFEDWEKAQVKSG